LQSLEASKALEDDIGDTNFDWFLDEATGQRVLTYDELVKQGDEQDVHCDNTDIDTEPDSETSDNNNSPPPLDPQSMKSSIDTITNKYQSKFIPPEGLCLTMILIH
jgi:hypothetical protein